LHTLNHPLIHQAFAEATNQKLKYERILAENNSFKKIVDSFFSQGGRGMNVTVPFKEQAFNYATIHSTRAKQAGAINTLIKQGNGDILGDNTDGVGIVRDIKDHLHWPLHKKNILVLGAGGAVRGILGPLLTETPATITIANRTEKKAILLASEFNTNIIPVTGCHYDKLIKHHQFNLIINATSASLHGQLPHIPTELMTPDIFCYDMMYSKELTPFLSFAKQQGVSQISDGLGMLVAQGAESFYLWRRVQPPFIDIINKIRREL